MKNWTEKYRPQKLEEVKGQPKAIEEIKEFIASFPQKKKAMLLNGPPGVGKTTIIHAFAKEKNIEIFELNASDFRNKFKLQETLKPALEQRSLLNSSKIILIDEVDGLSGTDRGGVSELISLIKDTPFPIIATANDAWTKKLAPLRKVAETIELKEISPQITKELLKDILKKEKVELDIKIINTIAIDAKGDLRAAINDLQTALSMANPEEFIADKRNKKTDIFNALREVFQEKATTEMLSIFDKVDLPLDEIILWVEENIPKVYSNEELVPAFERLSKVDIFKGRIYKQQYWRFLVYENAFLSYGISEAKGNKEKKGFYKYARPIRILKIWMNNMKHAKKKTIAEKYALKTHVGAKRVMSQWRETINILQNPKVQKELKLDSEEIAYVMKYS